MHNNDKTWSKILTQRPQTKTFAITYRDTYCRLQAACPDNTGIKSSRAHCLCCCFSGRTARFCETCGNNDRLGRLRRMATRLISRPAAPKHYAPLKGCRARTGRTPAITAGSNGDLRASITPAALHRAFRYVARAAEQAPSPHLSFLSVQRVCTLHCSAARSVSLLRVFGSYKVLPRSSAHSQEHRRGSDETENVLDSRAPRLLCSGGGGRVSGCCHQEAFERRFWTSRTATRRPDLWTEMASISAWSTFQKWVVAASRTMSAPGVSGAMVPHRIESSLDLWNMCDEPSDDLENATCGFAIFLEEFFDMPNGVKPTSWLNIQTLHKSKLSVILSLKQKKKKKKKNDQFLFRGWQRAGEMEDRVRC